ncbi:MAG: ABC transporter permease, partial [Calditrichia bacterium]
MKLYHISINSLLRRKARMIFLVLGLLIAVSTVITLITISRAMNVDIAAKLDEFGANILIVPKSDNLSLSYGGMSVSNLAFKTNELRMDAILKIRMIKNKKNISFVAPKLLNVTDINKTKVMIVGIDFEQEIRLKKWWSVIGKVPERNDEVLIGVDVQKKMNVRLNQFLRINSIPYLIAGILKETGSQDDGLVFMQLKESQKIFNKPQAISLIEVAALCYDCPIEQIVAQISEKLPTAKVTAIRQTIQSKMEAIDHFRNFSLGISIVILFVGAIIVFTTMMASVNERVREIGIYRAIGFRQSHVLKII